MKVRQRRKLIYAKYRNTVSFRVVLQSDIFKDVRSPPEFIQRALNDYLKKHKSP